MKKIQVENVKEIRKVLEKIFDEWDQTPEGVEIVFSVNTKQRPAASPSSEALPW